MGRNLEKSLGRKTAGTRKDRWLVSLFILNVTLVYYSLFTVQGHILKPLFSSWTWQLSCWSVAQGVLRVVYPQLLMCPVRCRWLICDAFLRSHSRDTAPHFSSPHGGRWPGSRRTYRRVTVSKGREQCLKSHFGGEGVMKTSSPFLSLSKI